MIKMIDLLYQLLEEISHTHPIHPPLTHIPMGLVIGVFIFALVAVLFQRTIFPLTIHEVKSIFFDICFVPVTNRLNNITHNLPERKYVKVF